MWYWNVTLDETSSFLTMFNSPFGHYRFLRMPFGFKMSQDIFQQRIDQIIEMLEGRLAIAGDIVFGVTQEEHDANLRRLLERCLEYGLKLNPDNCRFSQQEVKFYGVICGIDGIKPDPKKVSALQQITAPSNSQEHLSFMGLATHMSPFIQDSSSLAAPLHDLTKKDSRFKSTNAQDDAFQKI